MALWIAISGGCFGAALGSSLTLFLGRGNAKKAEKKEKLNGVEERKRPASILISRNSSGNGVRRDRTTVRASVMFDEEHLKEEAKLLPPTPKKLSPPGSPTKVNKKMIQRRQSSRFAMNENQVIDQKLVIVMVGLPARGKSYISKAIVRYLNFLGCPTKIFNAGNSRRHVGKAGIGANFFDASNVEAKQVREELAMECLSDLLMFLQQEQHSTAVGILDATNTTKDRRKKVLDRCSQAAGVRMIYLESLCDDPEILNNNYDLKLQNEDYVGMDASSALEDFKARVRKYKDVYEPVEYEECGKSTGFIKLVNAGETMISHRCRTKEDEYGVLRHIMGIMHSIHLGRRCIVLAQLGETEHERAGLLGGDSPLTESGLEHANVLASLVADVEKRDGKPALILCGTLVRHLQTAEALKVAKNLEPRRLRTVLKLQRLNELCAGALDSLPYKGLQDEYPEEFEARQQDKLNYRYPGVGGESYQDLVSRLLDIILRIEGLQTHVVILCDKAVCRVFLSYFRGICMDEMPCTPVHRGITILERAHGGYVEECADVAGLKPALGSAAFDLNKLAPLPEADG